MVAAGPRFGPGSPAVPALALLDPALHCMLLLLSWLMGCCILSVQVTTKPVQLITMRYIGHNKEAALALFHLDDVIW